MWVFYYTLQLPVVQYQDVKCIQDSNYRSVDRMSGFPGSTAGKESTCSTRDPSAVPLSGRSPAEGVGYPLQYSWASLGAQTVKNPPAVWETWVQSSGWEDALEEGMQPTPVFLPGESHGQRSLAGCSPQGCKELNTTERLSTVQMKCHQFSFMQHITLEDHLNKMEIQNFRSLC